MTPQEKAVKLVDRCLDEVINETDIDFPLVLPKRLALIAVDEILEMDLPIIEEEADAFYDYWEQVKHEIEKL